MQITEISLYLVKVPLQPRKPSFFSQPRYFEPSWIPGFRQSEVRMYLLTLTTDTGLQGVAAMPAMGPERSGLGPLLGNYVLGINPLDIATVNQRIQEFSFLGMRNGWIDAAFWDLIGKARQEPLWKVLGGTGGTVRTYKSTGSTHGHDPAKARELAKMAVDSGYGGVKLRVKHDEVAPMADYVAAARDEVGDDFAIMVDANQGWPVDLFEPTPRWTPEFALKVARAFEASNVKWLEEPLNRGDFEGLASVRAQTSTPIAGAEMNSSWRDFVRMLELGSLDVYQPDAVLAGGTFAGGISVTRWLVRAIQAHNAAASANDQVKYSPHTWTTGLGFAVGLHLVGLLAPQERSLLEYPDEGHWNADAWARIIRGGMPRDDNGCVAMPEAPGLGIEIDWSVVRRFGKRIYRGTNASNALSALRDRGLKQALYLKDKRAEALARSASAEFCLPEPPF